MIIELNRIEFICNVIDLAQYTDHDSHFGYTNTQTNDKARK